MGVGKAELLDVVPFQHTPWIGVNACSTAVLPDDDDGGSLINDSQSEKVTAVSKDSRRDPELLPHGLPGVQVVALNSDEKQLVLRMEPFVVAPSNARVKIPELEGLEAVASLKAKA